ncbi:hypothetical protein ACYZTX_29375 [Pseudomonas sp. MDT1-17]
MKFPVSLADVESLHVVKREGGRWRITLAGVPGWCGEFPRGLCMALAIERPAMDEAMLLQTTLWLASIPDSLDDSLVLEGERLFLIRRYGLEEPAAERDTRIQQHLVIVRWFATQGQPQALAADLKPSGPWV